MSSKLDYEQIIQAVADQESPTALQVKSIAGALVTVPYDYIAITYVLAGPGAGQIQTVTFNSGGALGTTVATLTLAYDSGSNLISVTKS